MKRVQLARRAGYRLPDNAMSVAYPTPWPTPYRLVDRTQVANAVAVAAFCDHLIARTVRGAGAPFCIALILFSHYNNHVAIRWADSADKHDVPREDAVHAMLNAYLHVPAFDDPRVAGAARPDLWIGPPRQLDGPLIEVMTETSPPRDVLVFHVMQARAKFLALLDEESD